MFRGKIAATGIAFGSFLAGYFTDQFISRSESFKDIANAYLSHSQITQKPGLPIFGTVSAAVPAISGKGAEVKAIPPEPAYNAPRVSQVFVYMSFHHQLPLQISFTDHEIWLPRLG